MESGKSLYIEGYNFAEDHHESELFNSLGCNYVANGNEIGDIWHLNGNAATFISNMQFEYGHFPSPKVRTDVIEADEGQLLFYSQDSMGYAVIFDNGKYKVITSTFLFAALLDGTDQNTKIELMRRYLQFFEGTLSVEEIISHNSTPDNCVLFQNYPNPFINTTLIKFKLPDKADRYSLTFFNLLGQEVKKFNNINNFQNNNFLIWDGTNNSHTSLPSGTYIYQLKTENKTVCKKMNLIR